MNPSIRKYAETHEWVKVEGALAIVGISDHAQDALGDITSVELPKTGSPASQRKEICVIESVKAASDIYAPVSGIIAEVNSKLETSPEIINASPYENGWIFKVKNFNASELNSLMDETQYQQFLESHE
jgi:glycine cleavage system H protein